MLAPYPEGFVSSVFQSNKDVSVSLFSQEGGVGHVYHHTSIYELQKLFNSNAWWHAGIFQKT